MRRSVLSVGILGRDDATEQNVLSAGISSGGDVTQHNTLKTQQRQERTAATYIHVHVRGVHKIQTSPHRCNNSANKYKFNLRNYILHDKKQQQQCDKSKETLL